MSDDRTAEIAAEFFSDELPPRPSMPRAPKRKRRQRDQTIRALELFVRAVDGAEPHEINAAVRWLYARYVENSKA
jgi:hypothetical protein